MLYRERHFVGEKGNGVHPSDKPVSYRPSSGRNTEIITDRYIEEMARIHLLSHDEELGLGSVLSKTYKKADNETTFPSEPALAVLPIL